MGVGGEGRVAVVVRYRCGGRAPPMVLLVVEWRWYGKLWYV